MARKTTSSGLTKNISAVSADTASDQQIDGILSGVAWDTDGSLLNGSLSFSFPDNGTDYGKSYGSGEHRKNFGSFTGQEQLAFYNVLANFGSIDTDNAAISGSGYVSAVTPLNFVELGDGIGDDTDKDALLRFGKTDMNSAEAWAYYPSSSPTGGDAWFSNKYMDFSNLKIGSEDYTVLLHETGHALGLKHSFEKTAYGVVPIDSLSYTVMSYSSYENGSSWEGGTAFDFPQTLMMNDIAALQYMYGANWNANAGDTTYTWSKHNNTLSIKDGSADPRSFDPQGDKIYQTLWDGNGTDTYNFADYTTNLVVDLRPGHWVQTDVVNNFQTADIDGALGDRLAPGNIANALMVNQDPRSLIENAIGGDGSDKFIANQADNTFTGDGSALDAAGSVDKDIFVWLQLTDLLNTSVANDRDWIRDFEVKVDHIDVSAIDIIDESHSTYSNGTLELRDSGNNVVAEIQVTVIGGGGFSPEDWFV